MMIMKAYERLLEYAKTDTTSDESKAGKTSPSSQGQLVLAAQLVSEMKSLGISDARVDKFGYVYGTVAANCESSAPVLGLIAHMDTSPSASGSGIKPRIVKNYDGGDIVLNKEKDIVMRAADYENLALYKGLDLIVTDGTTLLGADDKAGVAEILTAVEELAGSGIKHGKIKIAFTPDEEIGCGTDNFDVEGFGADYAYTVDGGTLGEIEYENFNAASAKLVIHGLSIHPGSARNKLKNALLIGMEFNSLLPAHEIPFCTEGYEGFFHLTGMSGDEETANMSYIIRDHDMDKFKARRQRMEKAAEYINGLYGDGTVELELRDSYYNMREKIEPCMFLIENAEKAIASTGVEPKTVPIRGGTDGARLSFMGLPCPNLPTGGENFHGRFEYIPVQAMEKMTQALVELIRNWNGK
jgi:tripeptide aminopeptidase